MCEIVRHVGTRETVSSRTCVLKAFALKLRITGSERKGGH